MSALIKCKACTKEISKKAKACPHCGEELPKKTTLTTWFVTVIIGFIALGAILPDNSPSSSAPPRPRLESKVTLENMSWRKGGFDTVAVADFTIKNNNTVSVKDIQVTCEAVAASGTVLGTVKETVYETIAPQKTKRVRDLNMGFIHSQTKNIGCRITAVSPG